NWLVEHVSFGRDMQLLVFSLVVANIGSRIEMNFFSLYVRDLGASIQDLGWVMSITTVFTALLSLVGGWASDRYNRNVLLALGPSIGAIGAAAKALAPTWGWLIPGMFISAFSSIFVGPALFGLVSDLAPPTRRGAFFGYQQMFLGLCSVIGPLIGGVVYQAYGFRVLLAGQAVMLLAAAFLRYQVHDPRDVRRKAEGRRGLSFTANYVSFFMLLKDRPQLRIFLSIGLLASFGAGLATSLTSVFIKEQLGLSLVALGTVAAIAAFVGLPANLIGGAMADGRGGRKWTFVAGLAATAAQMVLLVFMRSPLRLVLLMASTGFLLAIANPANQALMADLVPSDLRGTFASVSGSLGRFAAMPGPAIGAMLWTRLNPRAPFIAAGALTAAAALTVALLIKEPKRV
ncbi:MAG: MFS transporter, partial [Bacillota bacterium]